MPIGVCKKKKMRRQLPQWASVHAKTGHQSGQAARGSKSTRHSYTKEIWTSSVNVWNWSLSGVSIPRQLTELANKVAQSHFRSMEAHVVQTWKECRGEMVDTCSTESEQVGGGCCRLFAHARASWMVYPSMYGSKYKLTLEKLIHTCPRLGCEIRLKSSFPR